MNTKTLDKANVPWTNKLDEDFHVVVYKDAYPVSFGHVLFVPKYDTPEVVKDALYDAYKYGLELIRSGEADGFNIGMNIGEAAGQTVMYPHVHVIPRFQGDVKDPRGGIRHVIPKKGNYLDSKETS